MTRGLLVVTHGSTRSPLRADRGALGRVVTDPRLGAAYDWVRPAFFRQQDPSLADCLAKPQADRLDILPLLCGEGYFTETVLPELAATCPVPVRVLPVLGSHPAVPRLLCEQPLAILAERGWAGADTALVVVGHGGRDPKNAQALHRCITCVTERGPFGQVLALFLDQEPALTLWPSLVTRRNIIVAPFLMGGGGHARQDIPNAFADPLGRQVVLADPLGDHRELGDMAADLVLGAVQTPGCAPAC